VYIADTVCRSVVLYFCFQLAVSLLIVGPLTDQQGKGCLHQCQCPLNVCHARIMCAFVAVHVSSDCAEIQPSAEAQDDAVARRLWDVSVELVHLQDSEIHAAL